MEQVNLADGRAEVQPGGREIVSTEFIDPQSLYDEDEEEVETCRQCGRDCLNGSVICSEDCANALARGMGA